MSSGSEYELILPVTLVEGWINEVGDLLQRFSPQVPTGRNLSGFSLIFTSKVRSGIWTSLSGTSLVP